MKQLEFEIAKTLNRVEELNRDIDNKTSDLQSLEQKTADCEREIT